MDIDQKQLEAIDHLVKQASVLKGSTLVPLIVEATSNPSLFAFSEILCVPNVVEVLRALPGAIAVSLLVCSPDNKEFPFTDGGL